jgi:predicted PhzF superfamily epimerase YddE/YHI9
MATAARGRMLIEKVTARVFCQLEGGGNPVTIFKSQSPLKPSTQARLAQGCEWESVCVSSSSTSPSTTSPNANTSATLPSMAFYMPTGEQVSFCAHAAMGGALQLAQTPEQPLQFTAAALMPNDNDDDNDDDNGDTDSAGTPTTPTTPYTAIVHDHDIVSLEMEADFTETAVPHRPTLHRIIRDCCGLESTDLTTTSTRSSSETATTTVPPTFCNSSIARPKTLVYVNSVEALHQAKAPTPSTADAFRISCDAVESTGLYLYAPAVAEDVDADDALNNSWECRQFPRASGYPEDPATGIAAAALAASLYRRGTKLPAYKFYQGTAMGQPSLIMVENLKLTDNLVQEDSDDVKGEKTSRASFRLLGRIEVDQRDQLEVDDDA